MKLHIIALVVAYSTMITGSQADRSESFKEKLLDECHFNNIPIFTSEIPGSNPVRYYLSDQDLERIEAHHKKCGWIFDENTVRTAVTYHFYQRIGLSEQMDAWVQQQQKMREAQLKEK